jgi:hypothetical protein
LPGAQCLAGGHVRPLFEGEDFHWHISGPHFRDYREAIQWPRDVGFLIDGTGPIATIARISQMAIAVMGDRKGAAFNRIARSKGDRL